MNSCQPGNQQEQQEPERAKKNRTIWAALLRCRTPAATLQIILQPAKNSTRKIAFYDPILSGGKDVACATCHHPEFGYAESLEISIGVNGSGLGEQRTFNTPNDIPFTKRNSQSILNTAFNGIDINGNYSPEKAPMFWDLRASGLEAQAQFPIKLLKKCVGMGLKKHRLHKRW